MPINLTKLPLLLSPLKKFNWWFWGILLFLFIIIGSLSTFILSFYYPLPNILFIFGVLVLPISIWLFSLLYGLYYRGYQEVYIKQWNIRFNERRELLISYARRGLYVLHKSIISEYGTSGHARNISSGQLVMSAKVPNQGLGVVSHTALPLPNNIATSNFYERLRVIFNQWSNESKLLFTQLPNDKKIHVRLFIDTPSKVNNIEKLWLETLGKIVHSNSFNIENTKGCTTFIEQWLDSSDHDYELILLISVHLFDSPIKNEGESAVMLLLAGEQAIPLSELLEQQPQVVKIYRSEQTGQLQQTLDNTLLWANEYIKNYDGVWYSGVDAELNIEIMNYFNQIKFEHGNVFNIDESIGFTQDSAYFLALALAIEQTLTTKNKQLIIIGQPDVTASVVTSITKEKK